MFVFSNFIDALAYFINILLNIMMILIFVRAIISWFNPDPFNTVYQLLMRVTEPVLEPVRRLLPPMGFDLSPLIVFFLIRFLQMFLIPTLYELAMRMQ